MYNHCNVPTPIRLCFGYGAHRQSIRESGMLKDLCGKVTLLVTPAEEFCDMDYRKGLIKEGKISHPSGKQEMIATGIFDDVDIMLSCHAMGIDMTKYHAEIGSSLNGFIMKRAIFTGKASHAQRGKPCHDRDQLSERDFPSR